jgi:cell division septal protein FtsQ
MTMIMEADQRREWMKSRRKQRKATRRARSRRQTLRYVLLFGMLIAAAACFTHLPWALHNEKTEVIVHGNSVATKDQVLKLVKNAVNVPIYRIDPKKLENQIASLKAVRHAFVRRYALPKPHLVVEILEEYPWATYSPDPTKPAEAVIAQSGRFISIAEFPAVVRPHLVIYGRHSLKLTSREVAQWASWANYISSQTGRPVDYIDMRQPFDVKVANGDLTLKIGLPDATLTRRLGRLVSILPTVEPIKDKVEFIDLGLDNSIPLKISKNPKRPTEKSEAEDARNEALNNIPESIQGALSSTPSNGQPQANSAAAPTATTGSISSPAPSPLPNTKPNPAVAQTSNTL